jgi:hypothetical protein
LIVAYAMGGGLGHVRRARAALAALAPGAGNAILTASRLASGDDLIRVPRRLAASPAAFADWLRAELRSLAPSAMLVDAFPLGILGELALPRVLPDVPLYHLARLLRWDAYAGAFPGAPPRYSAVYVVEALTPRHEAFLRSHCARLERMNLPPGSQAAPAEDPLAQWRLPRRPLWLVVHSGPEAEVRALLEFARHRACAEGVEPRFVVVSPGTDDAGSDVVRLAHAPASALFPYAERIVTACGFNCMREAEPYAERHLFMPFARRFDIQALRAVRRLRARRSANSFASA